MADLLHTGEAYAAAEKQSAEGGRRISGIEAPSWRRSFEQTSWALADTQALEDGAPARECTAYEFFDCMTPSYDSYTQGVIEQSCHCPVPCFNRQYKPSVSTLTSPSLHWSTYAADQLQVTPEHFRDNICSLVIFMKELSIETISQQIKYPFFSLLCDIGGSLGLWLGGSILTLFEVVDLFSIATYVYTKMKQRI
eukprot:XP_011677012.1 PREDICTED: acid-sensing ion channel 3-like [Strongylocentrotus purpuratus]